MEVCPLSRGAMFQPLSSPLQRSLCFFHLPLPAFPSDCLTTSYPYGRDTGLPCSVYETFDGLGSLYPPRVLVARDRECWNPCTHSIAFWLKPDSIFGLPNMTTFIKRSHMLTIPSILAPIPLMLGEPTVPHGFIGSLLTSGTLFAGFSWVVAFPQFRIGYY